MYDVVGKGRVKGEEGGQDARYNGQEAEVRNRLIVKGMRLRVMGLMGKLVGREGGGGQGQVLWSVLLSRGKNGERKRERETEGNGEERYIRSGEGKWSNHAVSIF